MVRFIISALASLTFALPTAAQTNADVEQRAADAVAVMQEEMPYNDLFSDNFIAAVPEPQFAALRVQMRAQLGEVVGLENVEHGGVVGAAKISIRFENAILSGPMQLEAAPPHKIAGLLLNEVSQINSGGLSAAQQMEALPGTANLLFARLDGSETIAQHNADMPLALGSAFKLYVLSALSRSIANGERNWNDVAQLTERSFPSGQMQNWPLGVPMTLHTLAAMMISISDNTATDQLIAVLGRDAVEAELRASGHADPDSTLPFLTTREMFLLKMGDDQGLTDYLAADTSARLAQLGTLEMGELDVAEIQRIFSAGPRFIDVEWFASPRDLARVLGRMVDDPVALGILGINLGMAGGHLDGWDYAGFKGGSEPGVLNLTWLLRDHDGAYWVLTMGWNNPDAAVSEITLVGLAQTLADPGADPETPE